MASPCSTCGSATPYEAGIPCQECFTTERIAQGLPPTIEDPEALQLMAEVLTRANDRTEADHSAA